MGNKLILHGVHGSVKGKKFIINQGESVTVGRSTKCDIILKNDPANEYDLASNMEHSSKHFQTISRQHLKIVYHSDVKVEVEDLSANGTMLDNERIDKIFLADITTTDHTLLLGSREKFRLEWKPEL